jgi:hypothetical protein
VWKANFVLLILPYVVLLAAHKAKVWREGIFGIIAAAIMHYGPKLLPQRLNDVFYACSVWTVSGLLIWYGALRFHMRCEKPSNPR